MGLLMGLDSLSSEVISVKEYLMCFCPCYRICCVGYFMMGDCVASSRRCEHWRLG